MKTLLAVLVIISAILATVIFTRNLAGKSALPFFTKAPTIALQIKNQIINLEVVKNQPDQEKGLSGRNSLATNAGMLFVFPKAHYPAFWMKNVKFSLDFLFLHNKKVVTVLQQVPFPTSSTSDLPQYKPEEPSDMVIELPAGKISELSIKKGDVLNFTL